MAVHKWRRRPSEYFGDIWVPFAHIEIQSAAGQFQSLALQIDSGAVVSLLRRSVADLLGLDLNSGRRIDLSSVGGAATTAYVHKLRTRFDENIEYEVPYAIADSEKVPNLLGRLEVFDNLQVLSDATLEETHIRPPWLSASQRRIWEYLIAAERHILDRWQDLELPGQARDVAVGFINRADQAVASAAAMLKEHSCYAGPAVVRIMFELALQFEYLMDDPEKRAGQYLEFGHVTKYRNLQALIESPRGPVSEALASSSRRPRGEEQAKTEFDRVKARFRKPRGGYWQNWFCKPIRALAKEIGWEGEYLVVYTSCSVWSHGDPSGMATIPGNAFAVPSTVFTLCTQYSARMLLRIADVGRVLLTAEQHSFLKEFTRKIE